MHSLVDGEGMPLKVGLTAAERNDNTLAGGLLADLPKVALVLADRGYDARWIRQAVAEQGGWANIPLPRASIGKREPIVFSAHLYKARSAVERLSARRKQFRAVATRYDKLDLKQLVTAPKQLRTLVSCC
jgi:transposase